MFCIRYKKLLVPYIEGGLDERTRKKVKKHIGKCERCWQDARAIQSVSSTLRSENSPVVEPAPDLWAKVSTRIANETPSPAQSDTWIRLGRQLAISGAVALLALMAFSSLRTTMAPNSLQPGTSEQVAEVKVKNGKEKADKDAKKEPEIIASAPKTPKILPTSPSATSKPAAEPTTKPVASAPEPVQEDSLPEPVVVASAKTETENSPVLKRPTETINKWSDTRALVSAPHIDKSTGIPDQVADTAESEPSSDTEESKDRPKLAASSAVSYSIANPNPKVPRPANTVEAYRKALDGADFIQLPELTRFAKEEELLDQLVKHYEESFETYDDRKAGLVLFNLYKVADNAQMMLKIAGRLTKLYPSDSSVWLCMGEAGERTGDTPLALNSYRKASSSLDKRIAKIANQSIERLKAKAE